MGGAISSLCFLSLDSGSLPPSLTLGCYQLSRVNASCCGDRCCGWHFSFFSVFSFCSRWGKCWLQKVGRRRPKRYTHTLGGTHPFKSHYVVCQDQRSVVPTNHYRCVLRTTDHPQSPQTTYSDHTPSPQQKSETIRPELYILPRGEASADGGLCRIARVRRQNYITRIMGVHSCGRLRTG